MGLLRATAILLSLGTLLVLQGCGSLPTSPAGSSGGATPSPGRDHGPRQAKDFSHLPDAVPRHEEQTRAGNPPTYVVMGQRYSLLDNNSGYVERGYASWYGKKFHGRTTSNGEIYDMYAMTAAHKTLRIPAYVQVTNLRNGRQVVVRVNDRGPFHDNRIIDLSYAAASRLGFVDDGIAKVEVRIIEAADPLPQTQVAQLSPPAPDSGGTDTPLSTPAQASPPPVPSGPALYLQMGSFISQQNAERLRARLTMNNIDRVQVQQYAIDRQQVFRVRVGPLRSSEEADRVALEINRLGIGVPSIVLD